MSSKITVGPGGITAVELRGLGPRITAGPGVFRQGSAACKVWVFLVFQRMYYSAFEFDEEK